ncbi:MAG TPA: hypothetical protein VMF30_04880 [Pirellulales bacterium]|nr:hypothetical protein [Pirellulales bacterium]
MSKKFKGKQCAYCGAAKATTQDHVFPRELFLPGHRANLPQAPACRACNGLKSEYEHYATTILPFGGRHRSARPNLEQMVPKRLRRNNRLATSVCEGSGEVWVKEASGLILSTLAIPVDAARLTELFRYIAKGLIWHHWRAYLSPGDETKVLFPTSAGLRFLESHIFGLEGRRVARDFGDGTVRYYGVQSPDAPQRTVWRLSVYGGITFADPGAGGGTSSTVFVSTHPREFAA